MLELLKVIVQPVILQRDDQGEIVGEQLGEPQPIYNLTQLADYIEALRDQLHTQQQEVTVDADH